MSENETYIALAVVAIVAYAVGLQQGRMVQAAAPVDPMAWLTGWAAA